MAAQQYVAHWSERLPALTAVGHRSITIPVTLSQGRGRPLLFWGIEQINAVKPNILIVGFGMPLQECWLMENWERIEANVALIGGTVFDYVSGELRRPPR